MELPPGFRFHPSDAELITYYLNPKVLDGFFTTAVIGDVDLNKVEPWDLPWKAKMGENEWYFFCLRDRKYPTGSRTNRATRAGYWKATGKDKEIYGKKSLIGMKKTLVFYTGRAPKGEKSNWVMHEYRLEGKKDSNSPKNEWVLCRVFKKASGGKKIHISCFDKSGKDCRTSGSQSSHLPTLVDLSANNHGQTTEGSDQVTCFSNSMEDPLADNFSPKNSAFSSQVICPDSSLMQDQSMLQLLHDTSSPFLKQNVDAPSSAGHTTGMKLYDDQEFPGISTGQVDLDCLWNY